MRSEIAGRMSTIQFHLLDIRNIEKNVFVVNGAACGTVSVER
jgi:hypothetical protein